MTTDKLCFVCEKPATVRATEDTDLFLCRDCALYFTEEMRQRLSQAGVIWVTQTRAEIALTRALKAEARVEWLRDRLNQTEISRSGLADTARKITRQRDRFEERANRMHYALRSARAWVELTGKGETEGERLMLVIDQALEDRPKPIQPSQEDKWETLDRAFGSGRLHFPEDLQAWSQEMSEGLRVLEAMSSKGPEGARVMRVIDRAMIFVGHDRFGSAFKWQNGDFMRFDAWVFAVVLGLKDTDILAWHDFKEKRLWSLKEMARSYLELLPESSDEDVKRVIDTFGVSWDARL